MLPNFFIVPEVFRYGSDKYTEKIFQDFEEFDIFIAILCFCFQSTRYFDNIR